MILIELPETIDPKDTITIKDGKLLIYLGDIPLTKYFDDIIENAPIDVLVSNIIRRFNDLELKNEELLEKIERLE
jgi:hypothetical protein